MVKESKATKFVAPEKPNPLCALQYAPFVLFTFLLAGILALFTWKKAYQYPDLYEASIIEIQNGLDGNHFTSVELVKAYIARIDEVNTKLHAVIEINPTALEQAAALDVERMKIGRRSPLHGIPVLLKDSIATLASEGMNTTAGSYALFKSIVPGDATVAAKLRKAGAILLGKTNMSEWSYSRGKLPSGWSARGGQTTNPYYPGGEPCDSSSGSGVATAVGLAAASLGTETDRSIICPSSYNNIVGIKPTVGLTSRAGVVPVISHQDTVGPMARSVADAAILLSIIAGRDDKDNYTQTAPTVSIDYTRFLDTNAIKGKRFGIPRAVFTNDTLTGNHPYINVAFNKSVETIRALGGIIVDPADIPSAHEMIQNKNQWVVLCIDLKVQMNRYLASLESIPTGTYNLTNIIAYNEAHKTLEEPGKCCIDQSGFIEAESTNGYNSSYYTALYADYEIGRTRGIDAVLEAHKLDALLLPSNGYTTSPAALAGYPIINVPLGFHPENIAAVPVQDNYSIFFPAPGIPFGLAFLGGAYSEPKLIGYAYAYEQSTRMRLKRRAYKEAMPKTQLKDVINL